MIKKPSTYNAKDITPPVEQGLPASHGTDQEVYPIRCIQASKVFMVLAPEERPGTFPCGGLRFVRNPPARASVGSHRYCAPCPRSSPAYSAIANWPTWVQRHLR